MPRGKNYVNQNKGMNLQARQKVTEECYYGPACVRKDCIYNHTSVGSTFQQSSEPCLSYLAGICAYTASTCRKRHPSSLQECDQLRLKYGSTQCRFGSDCQTVGCLYKHDDNNGKAERKMVPVQRVRNQIQPAILHDVNAFPPLPGTSTNHHITPPTTTVTSTSMTSAQPIQFHLPSTNASQFSPSIMVQHCYPTQPSRIGLVQQQQQPISMLSFQQQQSSSPSLRNNVLPQIHNRGNIATNGDSLNIDAQEFIPGRGFR